MGGEGVILSYSASSSGHQLTILGHYVIPLGIPLSLRHCNSLYRAPQDFSFVTSLLPFLLPSSYCIRASQENIACSSYSRVIQCWARPAYTFFLRLQKVLFSCLLPIAQKLLRIQSRTAAPVNPRCLVLLDRNSMSLFLSNSIKDGFCSAPGNNQHQCEGTSYQKFRIINPLPMLTGISLVVLYRCLLGCPASSRTFLIRRQLYVSCSSSCATTTTCIHSILIRSLQFFLYQIDIIIYRIIKGSYFLFLATMTWYIKTHTKDT